MRKLENNYLRQNPAKFSWRGTAEKVADKVSNNVSQTLSTIPSSWSETISDSPNLSYRTSSTLKNSRDFYTSRTESSPMMYGKIKGPPNVFQKTVKWTGDATIRGAEKIANFGKDHFISPYPNAQINTIETLMGKWIETDYETAKKTGGLIFPKFTRNLVIVSYLGRWLQTLLMPTGIPKAVWKFKQKVIVPPVMWIGEKVINGYRKTKKTLGINSKNKNDSWRKKALQKLSKLRAWVNKKISFRKKRPIINPIDREAREDIQSYPSQKARSFSKEILPIWKNDKHKEVS